MKLFMGVTVLVSSKNSEGVKSDFAETLSLLCDRLYINNQIDASEHEALCYAIGELRKPSPCSNCIGPGLAASRGYFDMRVNKDVGE